MSIQMIFQRYEIKYLLNEKQKEAVLQAMQEKMQLDEYGRTTIRNVYFDTNNFRLIRRSLEKPCYKEKLRIRSYQQVKEQDPVFVELKKKYRDVVYKRRLILTGQQVKNSLFGNTPLPVSSQIGNEIQYFRNYYGELHPTVFLTYEREAYTPLDGSDFRVTFDENILYRRENLSLEAPVYGLPILRPYETLMEIKTPGAIPLWMTHVLTKQNIFKTSFSKYGTAYQQIFEKEMQGGLCYA